MKNHETNLSQFSRADFIRLGRDLRRLRAAEEARLAEVGLTREEATVEYLEGRMFLEDYLYLCGGE